MIKYLYFISCFLLLVSCGASKKSSSSSRTVTKKVVDKRSTKNVQYSKKRNNTSKQNTPSLADKIVWSAVSYKGTPYRYAGITKKGMDCSGLVHVSFKERGIELPRSSSGQFQQGHKVSVKSVKRGDLLFFKTTKKNKNKINHVGLVTSVKNGEVNFIHASSSRGVVINSLSEKYYQRTFVQAKRVLN